MKNNTGQIKGYLSKALMEIPDDFALSEVRFHIRSALLKIENVEKKRKHREEAAVTRKEQLELARKERIENTLNPLDAKKTLKLIDSMIEEEKGKIKKKEGDRIEPIFG